ncbi:uncharacterized protein BX664DRAFT_355310 [Halteromyces radiatus]|uniref:uncharacterized protein n=1 Tax=Halteromyces radiatus TaxID=101107 RepID=UPI0022204DF5|nr:uncharacterized protein BX664DRAFT_355310 [Halteromyces radiatus]KAI8099943.1 hypothetical protein BX664DRAFT_355310 [Halteromyces radiatus]
MSTAVIPQGTIYEPRSYHDTNNNNDNIKTNVLSSTVPASLLQPNQQETESEEEKKKKKKKTLRHAVGLIVIDPITKGVLMLSSKKREGAYVLPKGDCLVEPKTETYEEAAFRVLYEAGIKASSLSRKVGVYTEANKKGKIIAHHAMFEVSSFTLLQPSPEFGRTRVWVSYENAIKASLDRPMSCIALKNSSIRQ